MKFAEDWFPLGSFKDQKTDGLYIDKTLADNLNILSERITDDMHFLGLICGHDAVGNGKSTLAQHVGCYLTWKINQQHKLNNTFTQRNIVFKGEELTQRSFEMPRYSVLVLDEGDDLTTHGMKELSVRLKRYFRKCRQLNQILLLILPSFFELPRFYALNRSHFLIDVKFYGKFERGVFSFYGMKSKKNLYLKGKKWWDYDSSKSDFDGRFVGCYSFYPDLETNVATYKRYKYEDMSDDHELGKAQKKQTERDIKMKLFKRLRDKFKQITIKQLAEVFDITERTGNSWLKATNTLENEVSTENENATI